MAGALAKQYERSTDGLRAALFDAIEKVYTGEMAAAQAKAIAGLAHEVIDSARLDLEAREALVGADVAAADSTILRAPALQLKATNE